MNPSVAEHFGKLARRTLVRTLRQPVVYVPSLIFPVFLLAVISGAGDRVTAVKGFPTDSYISFVLGGMMIQAAGGASTMAGIAVGADIESGFLNRLALTPVRAWALIGAQLSGVAIIGLAQAGLVLVVGLVSGASIEAGIGGVVVLIAVVFLVILAFGAAGVFVAVRTGSADRVHPLFTLTLGLFFMSSMAMPRDLITEDWFKAIATYNPMSYPIEAARSLFITGWDAEALALGSGIAAIALIACLAGSASTLRRRFVAP